MKTKILFLALLVVAALSITSCASSKGGCKMSQGYVGYGAR